MVFPEPSLGGDGGLSRVCMPGNNHPSGVHSILFEHGGGKKTNRDQSPDRVMSRLPRLRTLCGHVHAPDQSLIFQTGTGIMLPEWTKGSIYSQTSTCVALLSLLCLFALSEYTVFITWSAMSDPL